MTMQNAQHMCLFMHMRTCAYALHVRMRVSMRAYFPRHELEALVAGGQLDVGKGAKTCGTASRQQEGGGGMFIHN